MKLKKIAQYVLLLLLVIIAAGAFYGYKEFNRKQKDTADLKPDFSIPATGLIKEFEVNEKIVTPKYIGKVINVEGNVKDVIKDDKGFYTIVLGDTASMSAVRCSIDSIHAGDAAGINKGMFVAVKGICSGYNPDEMLGSDVQLDRCAIENKK